MRWLVTGSSGFLGRAVVTALSKDSANKVVGLRSPFTEGNRTSVSPNTLNFDLSTVAVSCVRESLLAHNIDHIIHCAGRTPPARSEELWAHNTRATACLLEACEGLQRPVRVVLVGSAAELGPVPACHLPIDEQCPCRPVDPYGLSKWAATTLGLSLPQESHVECLVARVFNPIGPGLPASQAFGHFARKLASARIEPINLSVGDLSARRDFVDVSDLAKGLIALALHGHPRTLYNVAGGKSHSIGEGLGILLRLSGLSAIISANDRPRAGPAESQANIDRITHDVGWTPTTSFEQSLEALWNWVGEPNRRQSDDRHAA
jgi:GDP-4-dehydro-6-deoxy-D-mannose reductase